MQTRPYRMKDNILSSGGIVKQIKENLDVSDEI